MISVPTVIAEYWSGLFESGEVIQATQDLVLSVNLTLDRQRRVMLMHRDQEPVRVAMTPEIADAIGRSMRSIISASDLRSALSEAGIMMHALDVIHYSAPAIAPNFLAGASLRALTMEDAEVFSGLESQVSDGDKEDAGVSLDHLAAFGLFDQGQLVGAGSYFRWAGTAIVDMGVLTSARFRRMGYGRALVRHMSRFALQQGMHPQYRCQADNVASLALARSAGFVPYGRWEVVRDEEFA